MHQIKAGIRDWIQGFTQWRLWTALAAEDIKDRYRRTVFGILWIIFSYLAFLLVYTLVFSVMADLRPDDYALYVALGLTCWTFISSCVTEMSMTFQNARGWILGSSINLSVFLIQVAMRNVIQLMILIVTTVAIIIFLRAPVEPVAWTSLAGLLLYMVTPLWLGCLLAPLATRFPDVVHFLGTIIRVSFFVTPILWLPAVRVSVSEFVAFNPFYHFIEIVRAPIYYHEFPTTSWLVVIAINIVGLIAGLISYSLTRNRIAYWI